MNELNLLNKTFNRNKDRRDFTSFESLINEPFEFQNFNYFTMPANGDLWIRFTPGTFPTLGGSLYEYFGFAFGVIYFESGINVKRSGAKAVKVLNENSHSPDKYDIYIDHFSKGDIVVPMFIFNDWQPPAGSAVFIRNGVGKRFNIGVAP